MGGTDTGPAVLHGFVGDGELPQVVADHLGLREKQERALEARSRAGSTARLSRRWQTSRTQPVFLALAWCRALETLHGERALPQGVLLGAGSELSEARSSPVPLHGLRELGCVVLARL